ncbi:hypothetical protein FD754_006220, partial [Muntiacus muntjak]
KSLKRGIIDNVIGIIDILSRHRIHLSRVYNWVREISSIDILHQLGLGGKDVRQSSSVTAVPPSSIPLPQGVHVTEFGVILTNDSYIESPLVKILPVNLEQPFTILIGLQSYRVNNAFLFSIRSKNRLQLGVQLLPKKLVVYLGGKQSVFFNYSVHDERWHSFAIAVSNQDVSMFVECGKKYFSRETHLEVQTFDSNSVFTLGSMNNNSVHFEGVVCQLDIIPSAEASANYCRYVKQQCRPETSVPHTTIVSTKIPENSLLPKRLGEKVLSQDTLTENKSVLDFTNNDSVAMNKQQKHQISRSQLTSLHSGNISAMDLVNHVIQTKELITEQLTQANLSLPISHHSLNEPRKKNKDKFISLLNVSDNITQHNDKVTGLSPLKKISSSLPHIKQDAIKNLKKAVTANLHTNELIELQQILNTTLYRVTDEPSVDNHLDLRKEGEFDPDATYPIENSYETEFYDYYYYEDLNTVLEMENLRGPKGDTGPPPFFCPGDLLIQDSLLPEPPGNPSNEHPGLISFRMNWLEFLAEIIHKKVISYKIAFLPWFLGNGPPGPAGIPGPSGKRANHFCPPPLSGDPGFCFLRDQCRRLGSIPGSGRSPGGGNGNPLQYSCLGNPMGRGGIPGPHGNPGLPGLPECWSGLPFLSPGDLPNPGIDPDLPYCRQILYHLSHQESPLISSAYNAGEPGDLPDPQIELGSPALQGPIIVTKYVHSKVPANPLDRFYTKFLPPPPVPGGGGGDGAKFYYPLITLGSQETPGVTGKFGLGRRTVQKDFHGPDNHDGGEGDDRGSDGWMFQYLPSSSKILLCVSFGGGYKTLPQGSS